MELGRNLIFKSRNNSTWGEGRSKDSRQSSSRNHAQKRENLRRDLFFVSVVFFRGMFMSYQCWSSCNTLSDGKDNIIPGQYGIFWKQHDEVKVGSCARVFCLSTQHQYTQCPCWFFILQRYIFCGHRLWDTKNQNNRNQLIKGSVREHNKTEARLEKYQK